MTTVAAVAVFISAATLLAQTPIPVPGQRGQGARGAQGGQRGAQQPAAPVQQAVAPIASAMEVTGPGPFFETFMDTHDDEKDVQVPAKDVYAKYNYEAKEYFVSGMTSKGQPYKTRIVIRLPKNTSRFSGVILAESMHPSGNPWVFHNTHVYSMTNGVIGLELLTAASPGLVASNEARYKDLIIPEGSANDIIAQVGALMKSQRPDNPLRGLTVRKMILTGQSASAGVAQNYLSNAHMVLRLADMKPIYDGMLPTSNNGQVPVLDIPTILVPTMRETAQGTGTMQKDNDKLRVYEFAGMAHIDSRVAGAYYPNPCKLPISRFPNGMFIAVALDKLIAWIDKGVAPPHADRFYMDLNEESDGALFASDEFGNVRGGIRNTYVEVPTKSFHAGNAGADPPIANANPWVANRGVDGVNQLCGLANYETALNKDQLKKLYKDPKGYQSKVAERYDELVKEGWVLSVYRPMVLAEAAKVSF